MIDSNLFAIDQIFHIKSQGGDVGRQFFQALFEREAHSGFAILRGAAYQEFHSQ